MYKKGDKVIILDYSGKPLDPAVVAEIEDVIAPDRVRLLLPDHACCMEFVDKFEKIDFKKKDGFAKSCAMAKDLGLYRQQYCGCEFSQRQKS